MGGINLQIRVFFLNNKIRILPNTLVNQIAAGEVVERPASIIKELVENSIDSQATIITVKINDGGKSSITVIDNGSGMTIDDLHLCLKPHATSKMPFDDIIKIDNLGFRGEALASIASVSKVKVISKYHQAELGYELACNFGIESEISPNALQQGTIIQVNDLFSLTPARLKFLSSNAQETNYCYKIFKKLALAHPHIHFQMESNGKLVFNYNVVGKVYVEHLANRCEQVIGKDFVMNSCIIDEQVQDITFQGIISIPTFYKKTTDNQYWVVNSRPLQDKFLNNVVRRVYFDVLKLGEYPVYALNLNIKRDLVDENVNPTKSEVRFQDKQQISNFLYSKIKDAVYGINGQKTSSNLSSQLLSRVAKKSPNMLNFFKPLDNTIHEHSLYAGSNQQNSTNNAHNSHSIKEQQLAYFNNVAEIEHNFDVSVDSSISNIVDSDEKIDNVESLPLGFAKAQLHSNWIVAQNDSGLIIVDQHAAHERINHELLKAQFQEKTLVSQLLLTSEIILLDPEEFNIVEENAEIIRNCGISFDVFGYNTILVKGIPAILGNINVKTLILEILDDFRGSEESNNLEERYKKIIAKMACHGSIRAGKVLNIAEMNNLLRTMEQTENYAQCSHGRPTFINISLKELEKLFGR